jgi:HD-GYP domain-containing protein (c-di-GMP phosphodiesterase class II)
MFYLGERSRILCVLVATQLGCLAAGLWIHHRFVDSSIKRAARDEAWTALAKSTEPHIAGFRRMEVGKLRPETPSFESAQRLLREVQSKVSGKLALVDAKWRIVLSQDDVDSGAGLKWSPLQSSAEHELPPDQRAPDAPLRGILDMPGGSQLAVAYPTVSQEGYLLVYRSADNIAVSPQTTARSLLYAGLVSFVWMGSVLSVATYLMVARLYDRYARKSADAEATALRRTESMARMRDAVIFGLAKLTESRDPETGYHLERIALFSSTLARAMRGHWNFCHAVTPEFVRLIESSSALHDIGKVGVEDAVLLKPGPLTKDERRRMQQHAIVGGKCIQDIERRLGSSNFLQMAREIAFSHHERWDGTGYPQGLVREQIPLAARIVAVADVYEALASRRIYKEARPHEQCVAFIREQAGRHFDPHIVEVFLQIEQQFRDISRRLAFEREEANEAEATGSNDDGPYIAAPLAAPVTMLEHSPPLAASSFGN